MTIYRIPAVPEGPVWLLDHPEHGGPLRFEPPEGARAWRNERHGIELPWVELLALGEVDDEFPGEFELHSTATPWYVDEGDHRTVRGADGAEVFYVSGEDTVTSDDEELAKLIVELVNAHAAGGDPLAPQLEHYVGTLARRLGVDGVNVDELRTAAGLERIGEAALAAAEAAGPVPDRAPVDVSDKTRRWLRSIIEDRPEGAYKGKYDSYDAAAAREIIRALFCRLDRPAAADVDDPRAYDNVVAGRFELAANELALLWRIAPVEMRVQVGAANSTLVERLDKFVDTHGQARR